MSRLSWFPFYVEDFRIDTLELKFDEIGVYFSMIVLCYARGGPLPGDEADLKFIIQRQIPDLHGHTYNRIVKKLLTKYFYRDEDGNYRQKRVELELEKARQISEKQRNRVAKRWVEETKIDAKIQSNVPQTSGKRSANVSQNEEQPLKNKEFVDTYNNTIHNIIDNKLSINKDSKRSPASCDHLAIRTILGACLTESSIDDLIEHRRRKKSPITARAAKELVKQFTEYGDPEKAVATMIVRGWTGFDPSWLDNQARAGPKSVPRQKCFETSRPYMG